MSMSGYQTETKVEEITPGESKEQRKTVGEGRFVGEIARGLTIYLYTTLIQGPHHGQVLASINS